MQLSPLAPVLHDEFSNMENEIFKKDLRFILNFEGFVLILPFDEKIFVKLHFFLEF